MKCAGVVVLYNPDKKVKENIKTYIENIDKLYIVDNTPNKDNASMFKDVKKVEYICNNSNLGIAKALNIGASKAIKDGYDWLLTMDQDSKFHKGDLSKMFVFIEALGQNEYIREIVGTSEDGLAVVSPFHETLDKVGLESRGIERPLVVMTSGNIINLKIYKELGGFKDWLFIDAVDFDYCLNAKKNGYEIVQLNYVILKHNLGDIEKKKLLNLTFYNTNHSYIRRYYITRNRFYINKLYKKDFPIYCKMQIRLIPKETLKILLFEKHKLKKIYYIIKGCLDYRLGKKGGLRGLNND